MRLIVLYSLIGCAHHHPEMAELEARIASLEIELEAERALVKDQEDAAARLEQREERKRIIRARRMLRSLEARATVLSSEIPYSRLLSLKEYAMDGDQTDTEPEWLSQSRISPHRNSEGVPDGYQIRGVTSGSLPDQLGIQNGDIVMGVGRHPLFPKASGLDAFRKWIEISTGDEIDIVLLREQEPTKLEIRVIEDQ